MKDKIKILADKIRDASSIIIMGHKNPDGDSLGAVLGMRDIIRDNFGKVADIAYDGNLPISYDFMPGRDDFVYAEKMATDKIYDLAIALDVPEISRAGDILSGLFLSARYGIKIDHHKTRADFADINIVDTDKVATAEMIYDLAKANNWKINKDAAQNLYTGIYTDTGRFAFIDDGEPLCCAADLVNLGATPREVNIGLSIATRADVMAQAQVLSEAEFFYNGRLAIATMSHDQYKKLDSGETVVLFHLRNIKGCEFVVILKESRPGEIHLSFRSHRKSIREIAESFGGGGHDLAAGGLILGTQDDAKKQVVAAFKDM